MKEMRGIHKFTWRMPSAARCVALAVGILATTGAWATDYYKWKDSAASGNWNDYANWQYSSDGETYADATSGQYPSSKDAVVSIPASVTAETLTITGSSSYTGTLTIERDVTLTGSFKPGTINGSSTLTLSSVTFDGVGSGKTINTPVIVVGTLSNTSNDTLTYTNTVTGESTASIKASSSNNYAGDKFTGDMSGFRGEIVGSWRNNGNRDYTKIGSVNSSSANAVWSLGGNGNYMDSVITQNGTYYFGALSSYNLGFSLSGRTDTALVIGSRTDVISELYINPSYAGTRSIIKKVGDGEMKLNAAVSNLQVTAGCVTFYGDYLPQEITMSGTGCLTLNDYFTPNYMTRVTYENDSTLRAFAVETGSTAKFEDEDFSGATGGFTKRGGGTLEFAVTPAWTGATTVESGILIVPADADLTLASSTASVSMGDGRLLLYNESEAYVWTGGGLRDSNGFYLWNSASNWGRTDEDYPNSSAAVTIIPAGTDSLVITNASTSTYCHSGILTLVRDVTIGGYFYIDSISGEGTLTLDSARIRKGSNGYIYTDLVANNAVTFDMNKESVSLTIYGALSGSGTISHTEWGNGGIGGFVFYGDQSGFTGTYTGAWRNSGDRDGTKFWTGARGSADAKWQVGNNNSGGAYRDSNTTYCFGQLVAQKSDSDNGNVFYAAPGTGIVIEVGAIKDGTSKLCGKLYDNSNTLRKVGDSTMYLRLLETKGTIECKEGKTYLKGSNLPAALKLTGKDAELYVISTLDASSLVESGLSAYTVEKSTETETVSSVEYYKYTLTADTSSAVAYVGATEEERTYYNTIAEAIADAEDGATIVVTGDGGDIVIPAGRALSFTTAGGGTITSVTGADGIAVEMNDGVYTYACPMLFTANNSITGAYTLDGSYYAATDIFVPKETVGAVGTLNIGSGASLRAKKNVRIASKGNTTGVINVTTGGTLTHDTEGKFMLGGAAGANGTLHVNGGTVTDSGSEDVQIAYNADGTGTLTIDSGTFEMTGTAKLLVGHKGTGIVNINGGKFQGGSDNKTTEIRVGQDSGSTGTLNLNGGEMTGKSLTIGQSANTTGTVNIKNDAKLTLTDSDLILANNATATALLNISGGTVTMNKALKIAQAASSKATMTMTGGTITGATGMNIGGGNSSTGTLNISGGTIDLSKISNGYINMPNDGATGSTSEAHATSAMNVSGDASVKMQLIHIGAAKYSDATVTVTGGSVEATNTLRVGGKYNGGELDATATGVLTISGGTVTATETEMGSGGATGTINLNEGGTLATKMIKKGTGLATINFDGGVLKATAAESDFLADGITLSGSSVVIDTDYDITITRAIDTTSLAIVKRGTGKLTLSNADNNIDPTKITVEAGSVVAKISTVEYRFGNFGTHNGNYVIGTMANAEENVTLCGTVSVGGNYGVKAGTIQNATGKLTVGAGGSLTTAWVNLGEASGAVGKLVIDGGTMQTTSGTYGIYVGNSTGARGELTVNSGTLTLSKAIELCGNASATDMTGTTGMFTMKGGTVTAETLKFDSLTGGTSIADILGGTLTLGGITTGAAGTLTINGGTLAASADITVPAGITVKLGAATFAPNGYTITFQGVPTAAENATLTITVAEGSGSVVVPAAAKDSITLGENTKWQGDTTLVYSAPTGTIATDGTATVAYADGDTAEQVAAKYTVTLTPEQTADGLQSSYYKVVATLNNERTQWNISVALADSVAPEIDTTSEPMTVESGKVTFAVDADSLKAGLYYGVGTRTTPDGEVTYGGMTLFTGSNADDINFTASLPDSGVLYYTIEASDTPNP